MIADHLDALAKLYQVPNWDGLSAAILTEWIVDTYPSEPLDLILRALKARGRTIDKMWRLTPDSVGELIAREIDAKADRIERHIHNAKHSEPKMIPEDEAKRLEAAGVPIGWTEDRLEEWKKTLEATAGPVTKSPRMTAKEILEEGQVKAKKEPYRSTLTQEQIIMAELRNRYVKANYDSHGKRVKNWMSEDEWIMTNYGKA